MTSALRGEGGLENWLILRMNSTDRLREMQTKGGLGLKSQKFCGRHKWMDPLVLIILRETVVDRLL